MMECVPSRQHMSVMRERQRERGKLTGPERQATTALLLFTEEVYPVCLFRDKHHTTPTLLPVIQCPAVASTSVLSSHTSFQPTATSSTPAVLASLFSQPTFLTWFTGPYCTTVHPVALMAYEQSILFTFKKEKEALIQIQTSIFA